MTTGSGLGEPLFAPDDADVTRFGAARRATFTGPLGVACYAPYDAEPVEDPTFSSDACKQVADMIRLWPLIPR